MNDEEIKAIEYINKILEYPKLYAHTERESDFLRGIDKKQIDIVLNLIEKQKYIIEGKECVIETQEHNEEVYEKMLKHKDKMIDLMANNLIGVVFSNNDNKEILFDNKEDVKQYFEKKVEEDK